MGELNLVNAQYATQMAVVRTGSVFTKVTIEVSHRLCDEFKEFLPKRLYHSRLEVGSGEMPRVS